MPQLVPFYFLNEIIFSFVLLVLVTYVLSKYILPRFVRIYNSRIFFTRLFANNDIKLNSPPKPHAYVSLPVQSGICHISLSHLLPVRDITEYNPDTSDVGETLTKLNELPSNNLTLGNNLSDMADICFRDIIFIASPLDQFHIRDLVSINISILNNLHFALTNMALYLCIGVFIVITLNLLATNFNEIASNKWSISQETMYATIHNIIVNQINKNKGQAYFPFIYTLFAFILVNNLIGMIPYSFASTSHFILTFFISFSVVLGATILSFQNHGFKFFSLFVPGGCPLGLLPLLVLIEFISYLARNVSLGLRLAANILSGHMLLNILSGFAYNIMTSGFIYFFVGLIPLAFIMAFSGLELGIAFIQAQVFVVLTSSYIKDALDLH